MIKIVTSTSRTVGERRRLSEHHPGTKVSTGDAYRIGLASWIIQDGNYPDFYAGQETQFAVEFYPVALAPLKLDAPQVRSVEHLADDQYRIVGQVMHLGRDWYVLDFGLLAYVGHSRPSTPAKGDWVQGDIALGVDPFSYFESLSRERGAPALIYRWRLRQVQMQTAPWVETRPQNFERDKSKWGWTSIGQTDAWADDGGNAEYLLTCELLSETPARTFER